MNQSTQVPRPHRQPPAETAQSPETDGVGEGRGGLLKVLGPGLITGVSDDDPSGIATYAQAGAQFAYATNWTLLLTYPLMAAVQMISARLGRTTGRGVAGNLVRHYPRQIVFAIVTLLLLANVINIGADIGAMGDAAQLVLGGPTLAYVAAFGIVSVLLQVYVDYDRYVRILKWLTLSLLLYVATLFLVEIDWPAFWRGLLWPGLGGGKAELTTVVAVFGTTISPYLFFWQSSQEVEEIEVDAERKPLILAPEQAPAAERRIELDTLVGMAISNLIGLSIMVTAAATLNPQGITEIDSSAAAAKALEPVAGRLAETLFALGVVGTGILAVPVLAGSAAYAIGEALRWPTGLDRKPHQARAFYLTIAAATLLGAALNLTPVNPIEALFWSAVVNGVVAVPVMALMMLMATRRDIMRGFVIGTALRVGGWAATAVMAAAVAGMVVTWFV